MGSDEKYDETFTRASAFFRIVADTEGERNVLLTFHAPHFSLVKQEDGQRVFFSKAEIVLSAYEAKLLGLCLRDAGAGAAIPPEDMVEHLRQRREQDDPRWSAVRGAPFEREADRATCPHPTVTRTDPEPGSPAVCTACGEIVK